MLVMVQLTRHQQTQMAEVQELVHPVVVVKDKVAQDLITMELVFLHHRHIPMVDKADPVVLTSAPDLSVERHTVVLVVVALVAMVVALVVGTTVVPAETTPQPDHNILQVEEVVLITLAPVKLIRQVLIEMQQDLSPSR
jgi:hypothetical protein